MFAKVNLVPIEDHSHNKFAHVWLLTVNEIPDRLLEPAAQCGFTGIVGEARIHVVNQMVNIFIGVEPSQGETSFHAKLAIAGSALRAVKSFGQQRIAFRNFNAEIVGCAAELLTWNPGFYQSDYTKNSDLGELEIGFEKSDYSEALRGFGLAQSMNFARTLGHTPPNIATPLWIAEKAMLMASQSGLKCEVFQGEELDDLGCVGLQTVGKASENKPCMIRLEYTPNGANSDSEALVLVGKTVCYDTGGLSLKVGGSMAGMKQDKDGGCAVIGAMQAIGTVIKPNQRVVALLCAAENSVSNNAYRPDDVIVYPNGISVEVTNTDAEGRLVLADGLIWAQSREKANAIIDIATLTGGVVTALGKVFAGAFSNNDAFYDKIQGVANQTGERIWRMPLDPEYSKLMKSKIADLVNSNPNRQAHPVQGASFLEAFVSKDIPWVHLDIAGVHHKDKESGSFCEGPAAFGTLLLATFAGL